MNYADRLGSIPPYPFAELDRKRRDAVARGIDVISLSIGDPDQATPDHIIHSLCREAHRRDNHRYPPYEGIADLRRAVAEWFSRRFGIQPDPDKNVIVSIGSKEAIAHLIWAYVGPGDVALVPDPGYPVYGVGTLLAGGSPYLMPLLESNGFLPDLDAIPEEVCAQAKIMFLNYPNNPTAAVADLAFFEQAVEFCRRHDILLCHDAAYSEVTFDGYVAPSILQVPGADDVTIEFHSLSKTYNMTGWRIGFCVGNAHAIAGLGRIKENTDSGQFQAIQLAAVEALLNTPDEFHRERLRLYERRRDLAVASLSSMGWRIEPPRGTFYLWLPVPRGFTSSSFAGYVLEKSGVVLSPGTAFGAHGEGYIRVSLTTDDDRLEAALQRLKAHVRFP